MVHASINKCAAVCKLVADAAAFRGFPATSVTLPHWIPRRGTRRALLALQHTLLIRVESQPESLDDERDDFQAMTTEKQIANFS